MGVDWHTNSWRKLAAVFVAGALAYTFAATARGDDLPNPVLEWNASLLNAARKNNTPSPLIARNFALLHLAIAEALLGQDAPHDEDLAVAAVAACSVASSLYPTYQPQFEELCERESHDFAVTLASRERGRAIASRVLERRGNDGIATTISYIPKTEAGAWRRTPPFNRPPELPQWGQTVKPFVLERADQFRPPGPPPMDSPQYAAAVRETQLMGDKNSSTRAPEQTMIARFWSDFSYTEMPVGHWNSITRTIAADRHLSPAESARLFALLNLAMADAGIACWEAKYHYNAWRPVTLIPRADETKNAALAPEKTWLPLLNTPPHPEYPSGHGTFSAAACAVLAHFFGTDHLSFDVSSDTLAKETRHFESLRKCAVECGCSRIYGGIHFPFSCEDGLKLGGEIGNYVSTRMENAPLWQSHEAKLASQP